MFFEFRVGVEVMLVNLAQVTHIKVAAPENELAPVTFFFSDGREETIPISPLVLQRLHTALPRSTAYGSGGMG